METKSSEASEAETLSDEERQRWDPMAKDLYERYGQSVGWRAVKGIMPSWAEVRENRRVHGAWCIVARHSTLPKTLGSSTMDRIRDCLTEARRLLEHAHALHEWSHATTSAANVFLDSIKQFIDGAQHSVDGLFHHYVEERRLGVEREKHLIEKGKD